MPEFAELNGERLPPGVRLTSEGNIRIKWFYKGRSHSKTLHLPHTAEGVAEASSIRERNAAAAKSWYNSNREPYSTSYYASEYKAVFRAARKRGGEEYTLTDEDEQSLLERSGGLCELTGIPFEFQKEPAHGARRPYAPSLDRIDSTKGYTPANVRLVCVAANLAMNQWGEEVLYRLAEGLIHNTQCREKTVSALRKHNFE